MRILLKKVDISNFRDISPNQSFSVPASGVCTVVGQNLDNGGSNGAGKSSLIMSDKIALYGTGALGITLKEAKNRHNPDIPTVISIKLDVNGKQLIINRTLGGKLIAQVDDLVIDGKSDDVQSKINDIIGINNEHFMYLTYRAQGNYGGFLRMKDSDKKEFLGMFLNLGQLETAQEKINTKLKLKGAEIITIKSKIETLKYAVVNSEEQVSRLMKEVDSSEFKTSFDSITPQKNELIKQKEILQQIDAEIRSASSKGAPIELQNKLSAVNEQIRTIEKSKEDRIRLESKMQKIAQQIKDLQEKQLHTSKNVCYACKQEIQNQDTVKLAQDMNNSISALTIEANTIFATINSMPSPHTLSEFQSLKTNIMVEIQNYNSDAELNALKQKRASILMVCSNMESAIKSKQAYVDSVLKNLETANLNVTRMIKDRNEVEANFLSASKEQEVLDQASHILSRSGFIGHVFDSVLEEINSETNSNIQLIPNIKHLRLSFKPDKVVKSTGNLNKEITCRLFDGLEEVTLASLSGGEYRSLSIAVDEALDTILSRRLGVYVGYKFLDEPFDAIDHNSKEALLDFFKHKGSHKTYIIVDHASEFNAAVDKRIVVKKQNGLATIDDSI